ncbi:MAG: diguanylate cyclase [Actinomycetia bacterium]|nr:diguanylate cyclase [Actinomycetes bacterium]
MSDGLRSSPAASPRPALLRSDHYYWITGVLAARGLQVWACRLVAGCFAALGLILGALMFTRLGPDGVVMRIAGAAVVVSCVAMSALWLRGLWPSRAESMTCVIVGSLVIGFSAVVVPSPAVGFLALATFVVLTVFVVFMHTPRLLTVSWTIAAVALGVLIARLAPTDLVLAVCAGGTVVALNVTMALACWMTVKVIRPDGHLDDTEKLTGLLHREAFHRGVATLVASRSRSDDQYLVFVAVNIDSFSLLLGMTGSRGGIRARVAVSQALRETVRHNAVVAHLADDVFLVADTFTTTDASPLVERIRNAIIVTPQHLTASIGVVCTPLAPLAAEPPDIVVDTMIDIGMTAIGEARAAGGDQVRYVVLPTLGDGDGPDASKGD